MSKKYLLGLLIWGTLASCRLGEKYTRPELNLPETIAGVEDSTSVSEIGWGELYRDTVLQRLIRQTLAYNKDMQEDKELSFDAIDTVKGCVSLFKGMIATMRFNPKRMEDSAKHGFTNATDAADYLVKKGVPFRDAHGIVGQLVLTCIEKGIALDDLTLDEYKAISPVFEQDIYDAISLKTCVEKRLTLGAPGPDVMKQVIEKYEEYLLND